MSDQHNFVELVKNGDRELWLLDGELGDKKYTIPLWADPHIFGERQYLLVTAAVGVDLFAYKTIRAHLAPINHSASTNNFLCVREEFEKLCKKAPGVTPRYYYKWGDIKPEQLKEKNRVETRRFPNKTNDTLSFMEHVSAKYGINIDHLNILFDALYEEGPYWLIESEKTLDLGFVRLVGIPLRANWKQILLGKHPDIASVFQLPHFKKRHHLNKMGFVSDIAKLEMLAMNKSPTCIEWMVDVIHTQKWKRVSHEIEGKKLACGQTNYIKLVEKTLKRRVTKIIEVFGSYLEQVCRPFAEILQKRDRGHYKLEPSVGKIRIHRANSERIDCRIVVDPDKPALAEGIETNLHPKAKNMFTLSDIQPDQDDLRVSIHKRQLLEPPKEEERAPWVLVRYDDQS